VLRPPWAGAAPQASPPVPLEPPSSQARDGVLPAVPPLPPELPAKEAALRSALDQGAIASVSNEVQLGAWRSAAEAYVAWDKAKARAGGLLDAASPQVLAADIAGRGRYFRLRVRPRSGQSGPEMCARLAAKAVDCLAVRGR
jgi:hypothetical protein